MNETESFIKKTIKRLSVAKWRGLNWNKMEIPMNNYLNEETNEVVIGVLKICGEA